MLNLRKLTPLALLLAGSALLAQETTGTIVGRISDAKGAAVAAAVVRLTSPKMLGERVVVTDAAGAYRLPLLPNGVYAFTVTAKGYLARKATLQVLAGQVARQDATLSPIAELGATVEVIDSVAHADKSETVTATTFAMDTIAQLTTTTADSLLFLSPGITGELDPDIGGYGADAVKIRGGIGHNTKWMMNGADVTEEAGGYANEPTIMDMIESYAVVQSPLNARYGNTDGGIISMVTTRGSNTFTGTLRLRYNRPDWGDNSTTYPTRDGSSLWWANPGDAPNRTYDITLRGPIWKDHITFAYGAKISPESRGVTEVPEWTGFSAYSKTDPQNPLYTYYKDPNNGTVVQDSNTYGLGNGGFSTKRTMNQFVLYAQISENHSLEWDYTQIGSTFVTNFGRIEPGIMADDHFDYHVWNLGYKGIMGASGVLDAHWSHTYREWKHPTSPGDPAVWVTYMNKETSSGPVTGLAKGYDVGNAIWMNINGMNAGQGDIVQNDNLNINYQHILQAHGQHTFDVGAEMVNMNWGTQLYSAEDQVFVPGLTGPDTGAAYANKFVVFNTSTATLGNLGNTDNPNAPFRNSIYDSYAYPNSDTHGWSQGWGGGMGLAPRWVHAWGIPSAKMPERTTSLYANDLWAINSHHSVMLGLRYDMFKISDAVSTISKYNTPTVRFEYKWDVLGDQTRLLNVSMGQFNAREPGSLFLPAAHTRFPNITQYEWNQGTATPYLVDKAALLDRSNYAAVSTTYGGETFRVDPGWRAPIATEWTVGLRRTYPEGGYWRLTAIYKTWKNLFDWYPGSAFTTTDTSNPDSTLQTSDFHRILKNDPDAVRTYKSVEAEWLVPLTRRLQAGGNYTFTRMMSNVSGNVDNPQRTTASVATTWFDYYNTLVQGGRSAYNPVAMQAPEHNLHAFLLYDLTAGKLKSNVALRFSYASGAAMGGLYMNYTIPFPVLPGYDGQNGLPNSLGIPADRNRFTNTDSWRFDLHYTVEAPLYKTLVVFLNVDVINPFNTRVANSWALAGNGLTDPLQGPSSHLAYGWRATDNTGGSDGAQGVGYNAPRAFVIETGFKF